MADCGQPGVVSNNRVAPLRKIGRDPLHFTIDRGHMMRGVTVSGPVRQEARHRANSRFSTWTKGGGHTGLPLFGLLPYGDNDD